MLVFWSRGLEAPKEKLELQVWPTTDADFLEDPHFNRNSGSEEEGDDDSNKEWLARKHQKGTELGFEEKDFAKLSILGMARKRCYCSRRWFQTDLNRACVGLSLHWCLPPFIANKCVATKIDANSHTASARAATSHLVFLKGSAVSLALADSALLRKTY